jgi:hypothetical protein
MTQPDERTPLVTCLVLTLIMMAALGWVVLELWEVL